SQVRSTPSSLLSLRPALSLWFRAVSRALKLKVILSKWVSPGSTSVELADSGVREKWARKKNCPTRYQSVPPAHSSKGRRRTSRAARLDVAPPACIRRKPPLYGGFRWS